MNSSDKYLMPVISIPLSRAQVCLNCEDVSATRSTCPSCDSERVMPLATWLYTTLREGA